MFGKIRKMFSNTPQPQKTKNPRQGNRKRAYYVRRQGEHDLCWRVIFAKTPEDACEFARRQDTRWTHPANYLWTTERPEPNYAAQEFWPGIDDEHIFNAYGSIDQHVKD
jgi:hypothetical protein